MMLSSFLISTSLISSSCSLDSKPQPSLPSVAVISLIPSPSLLLVGHVDLLIWPPSSPSIYCVLILPLCQKVAINLGRSKDVDQPG
ncbi:hypothetical protein QN277_024844 [Acacia crassicarpa]|uniref:Uncharacterized protein n=1 Tax=Acacia crassicarpa TaxID=499986 RepID=A0AAE1JD41_9FABA|nr:hypothetical protein QN277_024844 [Acacia crassicarpa]